MARSRADADAEWAERKRQREIEKGIKDALTHITNAIQFLDGGSSEGERFLRTYWPHHDRHLTGLRAITPARVDAAIDYLTSVRKGMAPTCTNSAALDAAARAIMANDSAQLRSPNTWGNLTQDDRNEYLTDATAALTAARPHIEAEVRGAVVAELRAEAASYDADGLGADETAKALCRTASRSLHLAADHVEGGVKR